MSRPIVVLDARLIGGTSTGDSTYWTGLLHGLGQIESEFRFLLLSNAEKPKEIPLPENFEWQVVPARSSRLWSLVAFPLAARRLRAKAIHTQYSLSPMAGTRGITTIHDVSFLIGPEWFQPRDRFLLQRTVPSSARRARKVITVSETSRSEIESLIPGTKGKIAVTYLAGHPSIVRVPREEAKRRASRWTEKPFVLTVGTRWPRKNMALAVEAMAGLPGTAEHALLVTGKPGWGEERFGDRVKATGYVSFEELSCLYSAADLYLAPSRHEGFGLPLIEAFSCGCPVLCSSGGALPEVAGDAAVVEPSWDAADWTRAIARLLADSSKLDSLRARGLERASKFSWLETAKKTLEVYREVAE